MEPMRAFAGIIFMLAAAELVAATIERYPAKPVRVVVPFTAGSAIDIVARTVTQKLTETWHQQVVVDNRGGGGATIGTAMVAKAPADGYTLLIHASAYATAPALYTDLPYHTRELVEVASIASQPYVLVTGVRSGITTTAALIAAAKASPGKIAYGSSGVGTATHLNGERFRMAAGIDLVHVPYKGGPEATADTITGRIGYWFPPLTLALAFVRDGRLLALAVTSAERAPELPSVPTLNESGAPGTYYMFWSGMWAPARTPVQIVEKLSSDVALALTSPDVRERLSKLALKPLGMPRREFTRFVRSEIEESTRLIRALALKAE
jgi:tripartite-type tricarboxylate transporter receptor subunit TctC